MVHTPASQPVLTLSQNTVSVLSHPNRLKEMGSLPRSGLFHTFVMVHIMWYSIKGAYKADLQARRL